MAPRVMQTARRSIGSVSAGLEADGDSHLNRPEPRPFPLVTRNLVQLGAHSVEQFLSSPADDIDHLFPLHVSEIPSNLTHVHAHPSESSATPSSPNSKSAKSPSNKMHIVARLHQSCQRAFGSTEALKFEFLEENGPNSKQCILTITRPNGATRCYTTQPVFSRKNEAKAHVTSIAIEMGAIDFIFTGDPEPFKAKRGLVLAPLDTPDRSNHDVVDRPADEDALIKEIEDCCHIWRAGLVKPHWVALNELKNGNKHGSALRIQLSPHSLRVYSTDLAFDSNLEAMRACAKIALEQGVLDFIKFGNGQTQPAMPVDNDNEKVEVATDPSRVTALSLQSFYEALPKPFPEPFGDKTATEINAPAWLNMTIQAARGGKLTPSFVWVSDTRLGLHGCLLRIERPGESKSYLVDPRFPKRTDAKAAVCLQAMSQGIGNYIRAVGSAFENKVTPAMKKFANKKIFPVLISECGKIKPGAQPNYEYEKVKDAFGCIMKIELSSTPDDIRQYSVPAEYRTKIDAKISVTLSAVEAGVIELLRFRGKPPPPGYIPFHVPRTEKVVDEPKSNKRTEPDTAEDREVQERKKRRKPIKTTKNPPKQDDLSSLQSDEEASTRRTPNAIQNRPSGSQNGSGSGNDNGDGKEPHVSGSGGLGPMSEPAHAVTGHPMGQTRSGNRNVGNPTMQSRGRSQAHRFHSSDRPLPKAPPSAPRDVRPPAQMTDAHRRGFGGGQAAPYSSESHPPPEPFRSGTYSAQTQSGPGGAPVYPASQYTSPDSASASNVGYMQQHHESYPVQYPSAQYPAPHHPQYYQPPANHYPQHPHIGYSSGPHSPVAPSGSGVDAPNHDYAPEYSQVNQAQYVPQSQLAPRAMRKGPGPSSHSSYHPYYTDVRREPSGRPGSGRYRREYENRSGPSHSTYQKSQRKVRRESSSSPAAHSSPKNTDYKMPGRAENSGQAPTMKQPEKEVLVPSKDPRTASSQNSAPKPLSYSAPEVDTKGKSAVVERTSKSHEVALLDYCGKEGSSQPQFHHQTVTDDQGKSGHKVWIIMGSERLELPVTFSSVREGRERVAKQVLNRLRSRAKKGKEKEPGA